MKECCVAILTKNNEETIEECIRSIDNTLFDIVVIDTGSIDDTINIIRKFPDVKIYNEEWIDDFSYMRNHFFKKIENNWILFLDSDEYFDKGANQNQLIDFLKNEVHKDVNIVTANVFNIFDDYVSLEVERERLVRNNDSLNYYGCVHEFLRPMKEEVSCERSHFDFQINHVGYQSKYLREKKKSLRNLKLVEKMKEKDNSIIWEYYHIREILNHKNKLEEEEMSYFLKLLSEPRNEDMFVYNGILGAIFLSLKRNEKYEEIIRIWDQYVEINKIEVRSNSILIIYYEAISYIYKEKLFSLMDKVDNVYENYIHYDFDRFGLSRFDLDCMTGKMLLDLYLFEDAKVYLENSLNTSTSSRKDAEALINALMERKNAKA